MNRFDRLHELLELLVNDLITATQHEELQEILLDNSDAQDVYLEFVDLHIGLHNLTGAGRRIDGFDILGQGAAGNVPAVTVPATTVPATTVPTGFASAERRRTSRRTPFSITQMAVFASSLAAAAALAVFLSLPFLRSWPHGGPREEIANRNILTSPKQLEDSRAGDRRTGDRRTGDSREKVKLVQVAGAELFGERLPPVGAALEFNREYAVISGMLKLRFPDGAEVILEAPSVVEIAARDRLIVRIGNCSVYAPPGAEGFQVETPRSEIIDLGTRFSVSVSEVGEIDVQVVEGLAEVRGTSAVSRDPVRLAAKQARRFSGDSGDTPQPLQFDSQHYRAGLPDRIVSYQARENEDGEVSELLNVTVQRDGVPHTYNVADLIGIRVSHFRAGSNRHNVVVAIGYQGDVADVLESDSLLQTGIINPGGSVKPLSESPVFASQGTGLASQNTGESESTPGIAIQFRSPVVNGPGPDVVFFELQTVTNPPEGDAFHVSPLRFDPGLHSTTVRKYDIAMSSPEAKRLVRFDQFFFKKPVQSLDSLRISDATRREQLLHFRAIAVGIDLSDLGYGRGAAVTGLFIQDVLDDAHTVDPVFIAGLPVDRMEDETP